MKRVKQHPANGGEAMGQQGYPPVTDAACAALGDFATVLAEGRPLPQALRALASGLALRSAVVTDAEGAVLGVGGEALQAVPVMRAVDQDDLWVDFPVSGPDGSPLALLTVRGGRPSQLPTLRAAAAILGLGLSARQAPQVSAAELAHGHDQERDEIADTIHDGPLQSLMVARYAVDAAARGGDPAQVRAAVQQAVVELRQLVWSLRPRGEAGLSIALQELSGSLVKADQLPLELALDGSDVTGPAAALAYRLVQAVRAAAVDRPVRVRLDGAVLDLFGAPLPSSSRWVRRAAALGCTLSTSGDQTRLVLPSAVISSFSSEVRTTS